MKKLHIDFETRSELDLKKVGALKYAMHPSTEVLCVAYAVGDGAVNLITKDNKYGMTELFPHLSKVYKGEMVMSAFNAYFERCIFRHVIPRSDLLGGKYPDIWLPQYWTCTMAKACACGLTGTLDVVCKLLKLSHVKDMTGHRVMMRMCKPRRPRKSELDTYTGKGYELTENNTLYNTKTNDHIALWQETEEDFDLLGKYCRMDVMVEREIDIKLPDLIPNEQKIWQIDQKINDRGVPVAINRVKKSIELMEEQKEYANKKIIELTDYRVSTINQIAKIKKELSRYGVSVDSLGAETLDGLIKSDIPKAAKDILILRRNNGKSSTAKYEAIKNREINGCVHGLFGYHTATTGRWGSHGIQLHNLPRGDIKDIDTALFAFENDALWMYPDTASLLSNLIRTVFIAPAGKRLVVADYSAIEARVLNWLAGQYDIVQKFADNKDVYIDMAKIIYNTDVIDKDKRFVGKQTELGSGYGMSGTRFKTQCSFYGIEIDEEFAETCIAAYRKSHKKVVKLWYNIEAMAKNAIRQRGTVFHCNGIYAKSSKSFLRIKLLSGRIIYYYKPEIDEDKNIRFWGYDSQIHKVSKQYTYGAKIVENIVQGMSRDLLANALEKLENTCYKTVMHIHDEVVSIADKDKCNIDEYCKIVTTLPDWAKSCPMKAEGWIGKYYKKD